jgi:hypothetical protein
MPFRDLSKFWIICDDLSETIGCSVTVAGVGVVGGGQGFFLVLD